MHDAVNAYMDTGHELAKLEVLSYCLEKDDPFDIELQLRRGMGLDRWSINAGRSSLSKHRSLGTGKFLFSIERQPSSRGEEYYQEFRFLSPLAALHFWLKNRKSIIATTADKKEYWNETRSD